MHKNEDPEWHNDDIHVMWRPPMRCVTCGGHRVPSVSGKRPIATHKLWCWAWLAELPMRWLTRSLRKRDSRTWSMEEDDDRIQFGNDIHRQLEQYYRDMNKDE
jgi:hypothetical protein